MKVLLLAGEESGMIYARGIRARLAGHEVRGFQDYGFETSDLAVMGFGAVIRRLPFFLGVKRTMERAIDEWRPDVVCTVDYPGMNLKLAAYAKARGIRAVHVVCPQVWAWKRSRIPKIEAALGHLCCFFPFEPQLFSPGFASFVGHPLLDDFAADMASHPVRRKERGVQKLVALLPGSRRGEIERILPTLLEAAARVDGVRFVIPAANAKAHDLIRAIVTAADLETEVEVRLGGARQLLCAADCAAVASGTATLEAALASCPTVLVYRVSAALAAFARRVIRGTRYIGLANVIWDRCVRSEAADDSEPPMPELLQEAFTAESLADRLNRWLTDADARSAAVRRLQTTVAALKTESDPLSTIVRIVLSGGRTSFGMCRKPVEKC